MVTNFIPFGVHWTGKNGFTYHLSRLRITFAARHLKQSGEFVSSVLIPLSAMNFRTRTKKQDYKGYSFHPRSFQASQIGHG
jgi:hypothetical protein